jgi:uncharacterized protein with PIN domain
MNTNNTKLKLAKKISAYSLVAHQQRAFTAERHSLRDQYIAILVREHEVRMRVRYIMSLHEHAASMDGLTPYCTRRAKELSAKVEELADSHDTRWAVDESWESPSRQFVCEHCAGHYWFQHKHGSVARFFPDRCFDHTGVWRYMRLEAQAFVNAGLPAWTE